MVICRDHYLFLPSETTTARNYIFYSKTNVHKINSLISIDKNYAVAIWMSDPKPNGLILRDQKDQ